MKPDSLIFVAGHNGLVGSAIARRLAHQGFRNLVVRPKKELDLEDSSQVDAFFREVRPEYVFLAAAKVGGIHANSAMPADFIRSNLLIQVNVMEAARRNDVAKLLFLGSSCIYPREAPQPLREEYLLTGPLEPTNEAYAIAKIAGIIQARSLNTQYGTNFVSVMPTNLYGPNDNFDSLNSHVIPALIRRFHEAKLANAPSVSVWGTGRPRREFLYVDDMADACITVMQRHNGSDILNVGCGSDMSIADLTHAVRDAVGCTSEITFDTSKPDGTPRKLLDIGRISALGWAPRVPIHEGLRRTYEWFTSRSNAART